MTLVVELDPAKSGSKGSAKKHGVEENEAADGGVRVLAENHQGNKPDGRSGQLQLLGSKVGHGDTSNAKGGIKGSHEGIVDIFGIFLARLEFEGSVVAGEDSGEAYQHLSERGVDVEVVFMLDVVASKLAKTVKSHKSANSFHTSTSVRHIATRVTY